jgi:hypothetical protein
MAKLSSYTKDTSITEKDKLAGSSYVGLVNGIPKYQTSSYTIEDLGAYFSENITVGGQVYDIETIYNDLQRTKTYTLGLQEEFWSANEDGSLDVFSVAFANQVFSVTVSDRFATSLFVTNLGSSVGTLNEDGTLASLSEAFANQVFTTTSSDKFAESTRVNTLGATLGVYDANGDTIIASNAAYLETVTTYVDAESATASKVGALNSVLNILGEDGTATVTSAEYLDSVTTYVDENSATASKVEGLNSTLNLLDANGDAIYTNAEYLESITTHVDDNSASAAIARGLNSEFGITDEDGVVIKTKAEFDEEITQYVDSNSATAGKVSNLGAAFGTFDGETFSISEAKITEELNTYTGLNFSESTYFQDIESNISGKPSVYRQDEEPTISAGPPQAPANGSIWYDTSESNKVYILTAGVWTLTDDSRIGATASKVTNMSAAFGTFDENNNFTIDGDASYGEAIVLKVDTDSATATKIENLGAELGVFDESNNFATSFSADFKTAVNNEVDANSSTAGYVSNLSAAVGIDKEDGSTLQASASVNGNNTGTTTTATVDVAVEGSKTIQLVDNISNELIEVGQYVTFESSTWLYAIDDVWRVAEYSDTTNIVVLDKEVSLGEGDTLTFKGKSVIAVDGVSGVIREGFQVRGEGITVGTFVSDYTAPNLTLSRAEVLADDTVLEFLGIYAAVTETASVLADIDGNLKASWGMQVDANGNIAGMKLLADNTGSGIIFNADTFKIYNTADTTGVAPFEVKDGTVKIKSANIGDISFGDLDDIPDTFISTVIYADDINGTNPSTTKGSKNFFVIYQANVVWEDGDVLPEGLTFAQISGDQGDTGATGSRVYNTNLYYQSVVTDNIAPTFDGTGLEYDFSTNSFGGTIPTGWGINPPSTSPGSGSNKYYYIPVNIIEGTPNEINVGDVTSYFSFSGLVTFTGGGTTISDGDNEFDYTAIDGAWITTGAIKSQNFQYGDGNSNSEFDEIESVTNGTIFNLVDGYLKTPTLWLKSDGDAVFSGTFSSGGVEIDGSEVTLSANTVSGSWVDAPAINFYAGPTAVDGVVLAGSITSDYVLSKDEALLNVEARDTLYLTAPEVIISGQLTIEGGLISADVTLDSVTTAGNTTTNDISVNNIYTDAVLLDTVYPETATTPGIVTWNIEKSTAVVRVNATLDYRIGQQTFFYGKATEAISKGNVVMFAGVQGSHVLIAKADMSAEGFIPEYVIGVAAENFLINQYGHVIEFGELIGFDTTDFVDGDLLYLDPETPGGYVTTEPHASVGHSILIAAVINTQNATNGGIIVRPSHKAGLNELHDVNTSELSGGQTLAYNDVAEEWETRDIYHIHTQGVASATWVITHSLKKYPSVTIVDSLGNVVFGEIQYTDINTVTLTFSGGFSGKAYLN